MNGTLSPLAVALAESRIILASHSPRRRQLVADCGLNCEIAPDYDVEEDFPESLSADDVAEYLAVLKSDAYPLELKDGDILITADTVVIKDDSILGKPRSREQAIGMLRDLSSARHRVVTGVCLRGTGKKVCFSASTDVWFREMSDEEIAYYVDNMRPYDKAGAYGIQEWIGAVAIERIDGSYHNVMGLPTEKLYVRLGEFL